MPLDELGLGRRERTDADRQRGDPLVEDPPHDAGVGVGRALELLAQVGVGVELDDADLAENAVCGAHRGDRQAVLAAEGDAGTCPPP